MDRVVLETKGLTKNFGSLTAVKDFTIGLEEGEIRCIIGPNGAGKTTVFHLITGFLKPDVGRVYFKGKDITGLLPHKIARLGLSRTFQVTTIFQGLPVFENVRLACQSKLGSVSFLSSVNHLSHLNSKIEDILSLLELGDKRDELAGNLSHGDQRKLEIAIALGLEPEALLLDEPTSGMTEIETTHAIKLLKEVAESKGIALLIIEHDLRVVMELSDKVTVMHRGGRIAEGTPEEIRGDAEVMRVYLGG